MADDRRYLSPEAFRTSTDGIVALIDERMPRHLGEGDDWGVVAHGFLARCGTLLESMAVAVEHDTPGEAQILLRVLIEHVTTFCWLAIDPDRHIYLWAQWAENRRLQVHEHATKRFGIETMDAVEVAKARQARRPPKLHKLAGKVDEYWSGVSEAFRPFDPEEPSVLTFTGIYTAIYSKTSNIVHADIASIERFMTMPPSGQTVLYTREQRSESNDYPEFAFAMMGFLMVAFEHHFHWPSRAQIDPLIDGSMAAKD